MLTAEERGILMAAVDGTAKDEEAKALWREAIQSFLLDTDTTPTALLFDPTVEQTSGFYGHTVAELIRLFVVVG